MPSSPRVILLAVTVDSDVPDSELADRAVASIARLDNGIYGLSQLRAVTVDRDVAAFIGQEALYASECRDDPEDTLARAAERALTALGMTEIAAV